ncbi:hypothetical protein PAMA_001078 [Pampus argenteus]
MSLAEDDGSLREPSQENEQKESDICLRDNSSTDEFDPKDPKDKDMKLKDLLKVNQKQRTTVSPLTLFKKDLSHFKEEFLNVFKDKNTEVTHENRPSSQTENKTAASALDLLKEDFSQFRDDVSSVFRIGPLRERGNKSATAKDDGSSNTVKIKDSKSERSEHSNEPLKNLFRKDQSKVVKTVQRVDNIQEDKKMVSERSEKQTEMDGGFRGNVSEQNADTVDDKDKRDPLNELHVKVSEEQTESFSETQQSEQISAVEARCEAEERKDNSSQVSEEDEKMDKEKEKDKPSSGNSLFCLRDANKVIWQVKTCGF